MRTMGLSFWSRQQHGTPRETVHSYNMTRAGIRPYSPVYAVVVAEAARLRPPHRAFTMPSPRGAGEARVACCHHVTLWRHQARVETQVRTP